MEEKYYTCRYDRAFKEIFLNEKNKDLLKALLELIIKEKIDKVELGPNERNTGNLGIRRKTYDALINIGDKIIELEVNSGVEKYLYPRNMSYICDLYSHQTFVGEEYTDDIMIMQINFTYGLGNKKRLTREYMIQDDEGNLFVKNFKIIEINMDSYLELWYDNDKKGKNEKLIDKNKLLIMLGLEKKELNNLSKQSSEVKKYMENLDELNHSPEFRQYMTYEEDQRKIYNSRMREATETGLKQGLEQGLEQGMKEGLEQGIEQGNLQSKIEIAKNLYNMNMSKEEISKATGLTIKELEKII